MRRIRQLAVSSLLALTAVGAAPAMASAACPAATRTPAAMGADRATHATLCLLNRERARRGLGRLQLDRKLSRAARGHAGDMVARHFFSHASLDGATFAARIARTGWTRSRGSYTLGENLGWGAGPMSSPRAIVRAWMTSAGHRANILAPEFRAIGIGIAIGAPTGGSGATYTTDFAG
jgi:uncharacterized protein YkwD